MDKFTLVRHAHVEEDEAPDPHLSARGYVEAERTAHRLRGERFSEAWSSRQIRAVQTAARILAAHPYTPFHVDEDLCEIDRIVAHTGLDGEDRILAELSTRVRRWQESLGTCGQDRHMLVVGHAGPLRVLLCHLLDLAPARHWSFQLERASITRICAAPGLTTLSLLNDCCHLEALYDG